MGESYLTPQMKKYYRDRELTAIQKENGHFISMPRYYKERRQRADGSWYGIFDKHQLKKIYTDLLNHMEYVEKEPVRIRQIINKHKRELKSKRLTI